MDCHQVTSRALHDDPINEVNHDGEVGHQPGADLEKRATQVTTASYEETYPEGGLKAWSVVAGSWFSLFASLGLMNTIATFQAYVLSHQLKDYNEGTVGWIFSLYTCLAFFCGVYIGPVFDKYGPRYLVIAGAIFTVSGMIFMSFCTRKLTQCCISLSNCANIDKNYGTSSLPLVFSADSAHPSSSPLRSLPSVTTLKPGAASPPELRPQPAVLVVSCTRSC